MGSSMSNSLASSISVPLSKSSAIASYDVLSKTYTMIKEEIDFENLPIKYFKQYEIGCLKDGNDEDLLAKTGILALNLLGLITDTTIDSPNHWFLIAEVTNCTSDIDEMISLARNIIDKKEFIVKLLLLKDIEKNEKFIKFAVDLSNCAINLLNEYNDKWKILASKKDKNGIDLYCTTELKEIYYLLKNNADTKKISERLGGFEKVLGKMEKKIYYLIEKGSTCKGITKYSNTNDIFQHEKNNYHDNKIKCIGEYTLKRKIFIKDIDDYIKTLSDSYNLINDNCQTFVRKILENFT